MQNIEYDLSTHLLLDKMAVISQTTFSGAFRERNICTLIKSSLKFVQKSPIDNNQALI